MVVGTALAPFRCTRRAAAAALGMVSIGGVGAVYGHTAGRFGVPVELEEILRHLDASALRSMASHGVWLVPAVILWRRR
jgi:hypothetical protein